MARLRIAAVSYLNTVTFVHGMEHEAEKLHAEAKGGKEMLYQVNTSYGQK